MSEEENQPTQIGFDLSDNRREHPRPQFLAPSILALDGGAFLMGQTQDVSYGGIRFQPNLVEGKFPAVPVGEEGTIRISLNENKSVDTCCVEFPCKVIRQGDDFIALRIRPADEVRLTHHIKRPEVFVRRSNGMLEPGWEVLPYGFHLPKTIAKRIQRHEKKYANSGPVAVVCRKQGDSGEPLYKLHNVQYLKEVQELAEETRKVERPIPPLPGWE